ncbi:MAG TPA: hypothetical protein VGZ52_06790 [Acidimicrobiales bacterium]|nr:hypothetical protein [Acidimicrobiales bacterium]
MKRFGVFAAALVLALAAACSSSSSSNGNKTAFCNTNAAITAALSNITTADQFLTALKTQQGKFDQYVNDAPSQVKTDAQTQVNAAKKAIAANDATPLASDTSAQAAGQRVDTFCGVASSSSSNAGTSPSTSSSSELSSTSTDSTSPSSSTDSTSTSTYSSSTSTASDSTSS